MPQNPAPSTLLVSRIVAGTDVTISPTSGTGEVTINVSAGGVYNPAAVAITGGTIGPAVAINGTGIDAGTVPNTALAANGGLASLIGAGLGASISYTKAATGANILLASASGSRSVIITVVVDQTFANGDGAQPTFQIGQTGTTNKFADTSAFTGATAATVKTFAGVLTGTDNLLVTAVAGTGTTETGGITVTVLALPS